MSDQIEREQQIDEESLTKNSLQIQKAAWIREELEKRRAQEAQLLQSLIAHWNAAFPEYALIDPDALQALQQGLHIVDYNLHTTRYLLKETRIPAFQGNVTIEARLAPPLLELWNALLSFASHGGVGIKTTLGMGGAATDFYKKTPVI